MYGINENNPGCGMANVAIMWLISMAMSYGIKMCNGYIINAERNGG